LSLAKESDRLTIGGRKGNLRGRWQFGGKEEIVMHSTPRQNHDLAFYIGLNAALVILIASAIFLIWPL
jgi:hypothetical protein